MQARSALAVSYVEVCEHSAHSKRRSPMAGLREMHHCSHYHLHGPRALLGEPPCAWYGCQGASCLRYYTSVCAYVSILFQAALDGESEQALAAREDSEREAVLVALSHPAIFEHPWRLAVKLDCDAGG